MAKEISRQHLHERVWSKPRTSLTKEFGVSDVAIGKQCVKAHVPMPLPGYWAREEIFADHAGMLYCFVA